MKLLLILLLSFSFTQDICEGTCFSEEEVQNMYNNKEILKQYSLIDKKFRFLFEIYTNDPKMLPVKWQTSNYKTKKNVTDAIIATDVCNYIASMTDNYFEMKSNDLRS